MLNAIVLFVEIVTAKIIEKCVDHGKNKIQKRRSLLSKLLLIYNNLQDLRIASQEAIAEFELYSEGKDVATIVVSRKYLEKILNSFINFRDSVTEIEKLMEIYDPNLKLLLLGPNIGKGPIILKIIDIAQEITPALVIEDGRSTFIIKEPISLPKIEEFIFEDKISYNEKRIEELGKYALGRIRNSVEYLQFDLRDKQGLANALVKSKKNIENLKIAEASLREIIKNNFSMEQIFEHLG